jgi:hypothetical protein
MMLLNWASPREFDAARRKTAPMAAEPMYGIGLLGADFSKTN